MTYSYSLIVLVLVLFTRSEINAKIEYGIEHAIDDISSFIPGARFILTSAVKLWLLYGEVDSLVHHSNMSQIEHHLKELEDKLDKISEKIDAIIKKIDVIAEDIKDIKHIINDKVVMELPKNINMNNKRDDFARLVEKVTGLFELYLNYKDNLGKYEHETIDKYADAVVDQHIDQLSSVLEQISNLITDTSGSFNMIDVLANKHLSNSLVCSSGESPLHQMNQLYIATMNAELKSIIMTEFAYKIKKEQSSSHEAYKKELDDSQKRSFIRSLKIVKKFKKAMIIAHQDYWICDHSSANVEDESYAVLGPVFQPYIIKEKDIKEEGKERAFDPISKGCSGSCKSRTNGTENCVSKYCLSHKEKHKCHGRIIDCKSFQSDLYVCFADESSDRRYEFMRVEAGVDAGKVFGWKKSCPTENERLAKEKDKYFIGLKHLICEYCLCTCLIDDEDTSIHRYFNLRDVTSDVNENKVVTGVKFSKLDKMFHIQIQQGVLSKNGGIIQNTASWKAVDEYTIADGKVGEQYETITWQKRTIFMDDLKLNGDNILTGLRFAKIIDGLKLEIQMTPFEFTTGNLQTDQSKWISSPENVKRTELNLENRSFPSSSAYQYLDSSDRQYLKFTTSSMESDAGQNMVPFIDLIPITTEVIVPLAGAGLIHKSNNEDSAGFLSFKLFTYNNAAHLEDS